jgi:hypothetical protein
MSFAKYKANIDVQIHEGKPDGIWIRYSNFEVPEYVTWYAGQAPGHILLVLYHRAESHGLSDHISLKVKENSVAEETGLKPRTVRHAFAQLKRDQRIRREARHDKSDGTFLASAVTLLNDSGEPLTRPQKWGVCRSNEIRPFITFPVACLDEINDMALASQKATYISALALVSQQKQESVYVQKDKWQELSGLGRNAFNSGVAFCKRKKLLSYSGEVLTVFDPKTHKPNERWKHPRKWIDHVDTKWKYDLNDVPAERWQNFLENMLGRKFEVGADGWTLRSECPFCREHKQRFRMNFQQSQFKCDCGQRGRLGQLIERLKKIPMSEVIALLKQSMESEALQRVTV